MSITWSFSSLKTFQQCPRKYFHIKIAKDVVDKPHEAALYGSAVHKAAEDHIKEGAPIPQKYSYMEPILSALKDIPGEKHCELELGLTQDLGPCDFHAPEVWWHGIIDLLIVDREKKLAHMVDYKTSKNARYADTKQLDYMAVGVFAHFPEVTHIKSALLFVVSNDLVQKNHEVTLKQEYMRPAVIDLDRMQKAKDTGVWNPIRGPLCRFCPVRTCEHNRS